MTEQTSSQPETIRHPIPVPYSVLALVWIVALLATHRLFHDVPFLFLFFCLAGPALFIAKIYCDAEIIGANKDNPPPREYNFHAPGVWAQLEQTIKTLPGYFTNATAYINYQSLNPPKGMPMKLDAIITMRHPDIDKSQVVPAKQYDMKSLLILKSTITPMGNKSVLKMTFQTDPLKSRKPLDDIIDHICRHVDELVQQQSK